MTPLFNNQEICFADNSSTISLSILYEDGVTSQVLIFLYVIHIFYIFLLFLQEINAHRK